MTTISRRAVLKASAWSAAAAYMARVGIIDSASAQPAPKPGGGLVYAVTSPNNRLGDATNGLHPHNWIDLANRTCYNALVWVDENLELQPELATSWEADDGQEVWEVDLREGVEFHDGSEMTSKDVVSSFEFHRTETSFARQIASVEAIGNHKVRFRLTEGNSEFPYILAEYHCMIMPAAEPDKIGLSGIGTGPFKPVGFDPRRSIKMVANERYWRTGHPYLETLEVVNRGGQMEGAVNGFLSGQFDAVTNIDPGFVRQFQGRDDTSIVYASGGDQALMILPKYDGSPFNDKRVRQAIAAAIDRDRIARIVYGSDGGWVGNDTPLASSDPNFLAYPYKYDTERARALLAEAGYPDGITLPTFYFAPYWPEIPRIFQVMSEMLREAGITMPIEERPNDGYRQWRVEDAEGTRKHRFAYGPVGIRNPGISLYRMRPDNNESGYWSGESAERYMELYAKALVTGDPSARREIYHEMQEIAFEDAPAILPVGRRNILIHKSNIAGLDNHPQAWSIRFDEVHRL
ncbi:ABC transporter substrate-binding protein [Shinella granuli]|uniref:Peptide/nickel transport system substrate-binding protein n=1 Tax=Shinella granuli TaxID=323621 RepID=A0A4R2C5Y2_SHIGR|nr:ABC transporter substrate-binding protein [Shinella granuli]TCN35636.1 peptide/nickel transport system substrate-binding protein [Shinella granuli]